MERKTGGVIRKRLLTGGILVCLAGGACAFQVSAAEPFLTQQTESGIADETKSAAPEEEAPDGTAQVTDPAQQDDGIPPAGQSRPKEEEQPEKTGKDSAATVQAGPYRIELKASALHYGQRLKKSQLEGTVTDKDGNPVPGTFSWSEPETLMDTVGNGVQENVVFTPLTEVAGEEVLTDSIYVWLTVEKGIVTVKSWPVVTCRETIYDGDTLLEVTKLKGGTAVCILDDGTEEKVDGRFEWEEPDQRLEAGSQSCKLIFKPYNGDKYLRAETMVEIKAEPRAVDLQLKASSSLAREGEEIAFDTAIGKTEKLTNVKGTVQLLKEGQVIAQQELEETEGGWIARFLWTAEQKGSCRFSARYIPLDGHTAEAESAERSVSVVAPLSQFVVQQLPEARQEREYKARVETDASGRFPLKFTVESGSLPEGLTLDERKGILEGAPQECGRFGFCIAVSEKDVTVRQDFVLDVREKLTFSIGCNNIFYGEKVSVSAGVSPKEEFVYGQTFEGRGKTEYEESEDAPVLPGTYRVRIVAKAPEDYAGEEFTANFVIQKAAPVLTVKAQPDSLQGGGTCKLSISLRNPYEEGLREHLPTDISVSFDADVEIREALQGSGGDYTLLIEIGEMDATVCATVSTGENDCYRAAQAQLGISVTKREEAKAPESAAEDLKSDSSGQKQEESQPAAKTPEEVEAEFWQDVIFRIYRAQEKGDTVTINARGHKSLPDKVLDALRQHGKVSLALVWEGDMIVIDAGRALPHDEGHTSWTLAELSERYPLSTETAAPPVQTEAPLPSAEKDSAQSAPTLEPKKEQPAGTLENTAAEVEKGDEGESATEPETEPESETGEAAAPVWQLAEQEIPSAMEAVEEGSMVDWFLMAAGICAVCAIIVVAVAVAAILKRKN